MELLVARNPDEGSTLPYLLRVPVEGGRVFRIKATWPRTSAVYCHPVPSSEWPAEPEVVERVPLTVCERRRAAIDIVADRSREQRSQVVVTTARGRPVVFWQAPRTRKQARPGVRTPTARAAGLAPFEVLVDVHERYAYGFAAQQVTTTKRPLRCGDYAVEHDGRIVAAVERKSLPDLLTSLTSGTLRFAVAELSGLPRAAVVVEDRWSQVFAQPHVRPATVADALAELQVRYPAVPVFFAETRKLAEEWTYRFLAAALTHVVDAAQVSAVFDVTRPEVEVAVSDSVSGSVVTSAATSPTAVIRAWAREQGLPVSDRGRLRPEIRAAWERAQSAP